MLGNLRQPFLNPGRKVLLRSREGLILSRRHSEVFQFLLFMGRSFPAIARAESPLRADTGSGVVFGIVAL